MRAMAFARDYRRMALELCAIANRQSDPGVRARIEEFAAVYIQLAEKAAQTESEFDDLLVKDVP
jgi:hypothetical protein